MCLVVVLRMTSFNSQSRNIIFKIYFTKDMPRDLLDNLNEPSKPIIFKDGQFGIPRIYTKVRLMSHTVFCELDRIKPHLHTSHSQ